MLPISPWVESSCVFSSNGGSRPSGDTSGFDARLLDSWLLPKTMNKIAARTVSDYDTVALWNVRRRESHHPAGLFVGQRRGLEVLADYIVVGAGSAEPSSRDA